MNITNSASVCGWHLMQGQLECDSDTVFELAAYVLQEVHGDYVEYVCRLLIFISLTAYSATHTYAAHCYAVQCVAA